MSEQLPSLTRRSVLLGLLVSGCAATDPNPSRSPSEVSPVPTGTPAAPPLTVMSYNIMSSPYHFRHFDEIPPELTDWSARRPRVAEWIRLARPDLIGIQEDSTGSGFTDLMDDYEWLHVGHWQPIGLARGVFDVLAHDIVQIGNRGGDRGWDRFVTWAWLRHRSSGQPLYLFNTHLQPFRTLAAARVRATQVRTLAAAMQRINPGWATPSLLTGDLNAASDETRTTFNAHLTTLTAAGLTDARTIAEQVVTRPAKASSWNGLGYVVGGSWRYGAIRRFDSHWDYVWASPSVRVDAWQVVTGPTTRIKTIAGERVPFFAAGPIPSDHNPVVAKIRLG